MNRCPRLRIPFHSALPLGLVLLGCSGGGIASDSPDAGSEPGRDASGPEFVELIGMDFEVSPGTEPHRCLRQTVTEDTYVTAVIDQSPPGTHHLVVTASPVGEAAGPDGLFDCSAGSNRDLQMLFGSGVGSTAFEFPAGVGLLVEAGQQLTLNVHLYNVTTEPLTGHAGALIKTIPAEDAGELVLAEALFAADFDLAIPPTGQAATENARCTMRAGTLLNVWPHMHQLGTRLTVKIAGQVVHDEPFSFTEQRNWPATVALNEGDVMETTCTFVNDTGTMVTFGDSSEDEMCLTGFYRYPATGSDIFCTQ